MEMGVRRLVLPGVPVLTDLGVLLHARLVPSCHSEVVLLIIQLHKCVKQLKRRGIDVENQALVDIKSISCVTLVLGWGSGCKQALC